MKNLIIILIALLFSTSTNANVIGSDYNNFNPTTDGLGYVTTESGEFHKPGEFNLGLFLDYGINSMPTFNADGQAPEDKRLSSNVHASMGLMPGWSLGFSMTNLIQESGNDNSIGGNLSDAGREAFRLDSKFRFVNKEKAKIGMFTGLNFNSIDNNPYLGNNPGPSFHLGAFYERYSSKAMRWAANLGYRLRNAGDANAGAVLGPIENQIFYSFALNYDHSSWDTQFIGELYGSSPTNSPINQTDRDLSNLEILFGAKKRYYEDLDVHVGFTRGLTKGLSTPDFRFYAGLNWYFDSLFEKKYEDSELGGKVPGYDFKDRDSDGDGVPDADDYCPDTPKDRLVDRRGCPIEGDYESRDDDFDGVDNLHDQCPNTRPDTIVDETGCKADPGSQVMLATMDTDGDGVTNDYDLCPGTRQGVRVTSRGCEAKKIRKIDLGNLNFLTGTAKLTKKSRKRFMKKIDGLYKIRKKIKRIAVEGHTDNVGKRAYNQKLSQRRAATIRRILIKQVKISGDKVTAKGYGEDRPIASNKTKKGRLANRRVEMNVISH